MKKAFQVKERVFLIIFKGLSIAKNCLKPESAPLNKIVVITVLQLLLTVLGKLPLGKFSPGKFPPIKLPSGKSPPPPENFHPENSHLEYSHPFH